jgi:hypothetical protein
MRRRRTEDDLRAAFAAKAEEAPNAADVLRAVRQAERPRRTRPRWLVPAVAAVAVAAIAVPLALHANDTANKHGAEKAAAPSANAGSGGTAFDTQSTPGARKAPENGAAAGSASPPKAALATTVCRPDDVMATLTVTDATHAVLVLTARGTACSISRVPTLRWASVPARPEAISAKTSASLPSGVGLGRLAEQAVATAQVHWTGACASPTGRTVQVDWGAGVVEVPLTETATASCTSAGKPAGLTIGAFNGLG